MKGIDSNSPRVSFLIPQELVDAEVSLRMKHMDIDDLRYFQDDFEAGVEWAEQQFGNLAIEFANYAIDSAFGGYTGSTLDLYKEFIKYKESEE